MMKFLLLSLFLSFTTWTSAQTVYVTKTGEKYHLADCRYLKYSKISTTLAEAQDNGYEACKVCKPPVNGQKSNEVETERSSAAQQCSATTQAGARCKRRTKNISGKCWQHE